MFIKSPLNTYLVDMRFINWFLKYSVHGMEKMWKGVKKCCFIICQGFHHLIKCSIFTNGTKINENQPFVKNAKKKKKIPVPPIQIPSQIQENQSRAIILSPESRDIAYNAGVVYANPNLRPVVRPSTSPRQPTQPIDIPQRRPCYPPTQTNIEAYLFDLQPEEREGLEEEFEGFKGCYAVKGESDVE